MIGHHSRSREVTDQSCPIYGCARDNHARYSSVQVIFCDSSKHNLLKQYLRKKTQQVESVQHMEQNYMKFVEKSHHLKRRGRKAFA